jgi:hypothetical protein
MLKHLRAAANEELNRFLDARLHRYCKLCQQTVEQRIAARKARIGDVAPEEADAA